MLRWLKNHDHDLSFQTRCKTYVTIMRAISSVAFVIDDNDYNLFSNVGLQTFSPVLWTPQSD